jgi:RnfABCDGE-type electron transport complex B subunit
MNNVILSLSVMALLGAGFALLLSLLYRRFHVEENPLKVKVENLLPGLNCAACGFASCSALAEHLIDGGKEILCPLISAEMKEKISKLLKIELGQLKKKVAIVRCGAIGARRIKLAEYKGEKSCRAAAVMSDFQGCRYACLGFGDCQKVCPVDAISLIQGLAEIDEDKCVGCGQCVKECPKNIIQLVDYNGSWLLYVACSSKDKAPIVREVCSIGCIGCGLCLKLMADKTFELKDNLASVNRAQLLNEPQDLSRYIKAVQKCPRKIIYLKTQDIKIEVT